MYLGETPNQNPCQHLAWQWSSLFAFINQSQTLFGLFTRERKVFGNLDLGGKMEFCSAGVTYWRHPGDVPPHHPEWFTGQGVLFPGSNVCLPCLTDRLLKDSRHGPTCSSSDYHGAACQFSVGLKSRLVLLPLEDPTGYPGDPKRETARLSIDASL